MRILLNAIFPVIFNAMFFTLGGTDHPASVWISYGFVHFAYVTTLATPYLIREGKSAAVFGFSLLSVSYTYFFLEIITGVIFILAAPAGYKAAFLTQLCIAAIWAIGFLSNMQANEHTAEAEEKRQPQIEYVKNATAEMAAMLDSVSDRETKKKIEKVYDAINSSPVRSHANVASLESRIIIAISDLRAGMNTAERSAVQNQADALLTMVNERNRQLRLVNP